MLSSTPTPLIPCSDLARACGVKNVFLKMENCQVTGSFKDRGMQTLCEDIKNKGGVGICCSSGGNAGLAAAWCCLQCGLEADVFVPSTTTDTIVTRLKSYGATVHVCGDEWKTADDAARLFCKENNRDYVSPFDDGRLWDGHASLVDELTHQMSQVPDVIAFSVGGGGLAAGIITGLNRSEWSPSIVLCETELAGSMNAALIAGEPVSIGPIKSIATSLGAPLVSKGAFELLQSYQGKVHSQLVSDAAAVEGCLYLANQQRVLVEPACGATLAGFRAWVSNMPVDGREDMTIVLIICGGSGISLDLLNKYRMAESG